MEEVDEDKLVRSLVWSTQMFSLAEFVEKYELPQVVCVEIGYFGESERTTLSSGQLLTLHSLQKTSKVLCDVPRSSEVLIPLNCPLSAEVRPCYENFGHSSITAGQLATQYSQTRYVKVLACGDEHMQGNSFAVGDILEIKNNDKEKCRVKCKKVENGEKVSIPYESIALFAPLLDHRQYTLAEVKRKFGFPTKLRFSDKKAEIELQSKSKDETKSPKLISDLGEITALEEIEETVVISTTVGSDLKNKICFQIPKELEIQVVIAEGFMSGDENYQRIVRTLDRRLNRTKLKDFENLDVYQHLDAVKKTIQDMSAEVSVEPASQATLRRATQQRSKEVTSGRPPPSQPPKPPAKSRKSSSDEASTAAPPIPGPKPVQKNNTPKTGSKVVDKIKKVSLPSKPSSWLSSKRQRQKSEGRDNDTRHPSDFPRTSDGDEVGYVEPIKPEETYTYMSASESRGEYSELDPNYTTSDKHLYEQPSWSVKPSKPSFPPPEVPKPQTCVQTPPDTQATTTPAFEKECIYQAIARIPQDLSGLSVEEVGVVLKRLGMSGYVDLFQQELVDGEMLGSMDKDALESLNMKTFHITKLLKFINGWRPTVK